MHDWRIVEALHEPGIGARTALSARTGRKELPDMAVRLHFIASMRVHFRRLKLSMRNRNKGQILLVLALWTTSSLRSFAAPTDNSLEIRSATVNGNPARLNANGTVDLGASPVDVTFAFGPVTNSRQAPLRIRYELEGYENSWHNEGSEMDLTVRYFNSAGDIVGQKAFPVNGESAGWTGSLSTSPLIHRRETLVVPARASKLMIVISSAGPPNAVGIYVVANLIATVSSENPPSTMLLQSPLDQQPYDDSINKAPNGWMRDGLHPSMAHIVEIGQRPFAKAFAILDDDRIGHAEWHNSLDAAPKITPGEHLVVEWNEMYSIGEGDYGTAEYGKLAPGEYLFRVRGMNTMGASTGVETSLRVIIPEPVWAMPWFWGVIAILAVASTLGVNRYWTWHRMRREMAHLKNQQELERERLRIAHDLHDDLGARMTQISLLSAMSHENRVFPERARAEFDKISQMARELVSALYQTVWAVNPENDNLDALGNYLCQMVNQMCERTRLRCRFDLADLPQQISVSSQLRHNITMAVKEAVHNTIKHAGASEVLTRVTFKENLLTIAVQDNGCGFQPLDHAAGHGLANIKRRMEDAGGTCLIESQPGNGTTIYLRLTVQADSSRKRG